MAYFLEFFIEKNTMGRVIDLDKFDAFALVNSGGKLTCYVGETISVSTMDELTRMAEIHPQILFALPYSSIKERGFGAKGDDPIRAIIPKKSVEIPLDKIAETLGVDESFFIGPATPCIPDRKFAQIVSTIVKDEIGGGEISQVNISRAFAGVIDNFNRKKAIGIYKKIAQKPGAYMTYLFCFGASEPQQNDFYLIGASPECHLRINGETALMTPIAGTMRKSPESDLGAQINDFIASSKDTNELIQATDEEMKLMARISKGMPWVCGPYLRDAGNIIHTEYHVYAERPEKPFEALRETLFMPTVTGSPLESATRVISRHEVDPRGYYTGLVGITGQSDTGVTLDTAIILRTLEINGSGHYKIQAGGGITKDSNPTNEAKENAAKADSILTLLNKRASSAKSFAIIDLSRFQAQLDGKNLNLARTWFNVVQKPHCSILDARNSVTLINNEDDFIYLLAALLRREGLRAQVVDTFAFSAKKHAADLVILGPGPGDINDMQNPRMHRLHEIFGELNGRSQSLFGVCLGHQAICRNIGYAIKKQPVPTQGMQRKIHVRGVEKVMGFYNSFSPVFDRAVRPRITPRMMDVDEHKRIMTFFSDRVSSVQFHPESLLSRDGAGFFVDAITQQLALENVG